MANCCEIQSNKRRILWIVLWVNLIVFGGQLTAAIFAHSTALLADSIDMIGDAIAYGISIYVISRGEVALAKAALCKGVIIALFATMVFIDALLKVFILETVPSSSLMLIFSLIGLCANGFCLWILTKDRNSDINMRSVWLCARNDIIGNISVLITAYLVYVFQSRWPDVIVGTILAIVLLHSAYNIIRLANNKLSLLRQK